MAPPVYIDSKSWNIPQLDFRVENLSHPGAKLFFEQIHNPSDAMKRAVEASWKWLYGWDQDKKSQTINAPLA